MDIHTARIEAIDPDNPEIRYSAWEDGKYACLRIDYPDASAEIRFLDANDVKTLFEGLPSTMDRASDVLMALP